MGRQQQPLEHRLLLTATFCLLAGGAVMVYSASSARTLLQGQGDGTMYLVKYVGYGFFGLIAMYTISRLRLELIRRYTSLLLMAAFAMLVMVKIPGSGVEVNGATRWLGFGPLQFQPSEIVKLALVLHVAAVIAERPKIARNIRTVVGPVIAVGGGAVLLIAAQPDLGTCLVICFTMAVLLVIAGLPMRQLGLVAGIGAVLVMLFALFEPYRRARLTSRSWTRGPTPRPTGSSPRRGRSRSGPAACSATASVSPSRRSSTFPRPTRTSSSRSSGRSSA